MARPEAVFAPAAGRQSRVVSLLSLPHTGTRFLKAFLAEMPGVDNVVDLDRVIRHGGAAIPDGVTLLWGHFDPLALEVLDPICRLVRPIIPMRDPLAVAISHAARGYDVQWQWWDHAVDRFDAHLAHYLPLDRPRTAEGALLDLMFLAATAGMAATADAHCRTWAAHWLAGRHRSSVSEGSGLRAMYDAGDLDGLRQAMPGTFDALDERERVFRPWLMRMGYRDLMWWGDEFRVPHHWPDPVRTAA